MPDASLVDRLAALPRWADVPRAELEWLVAHGRLDACPAGTVVGAKGRTVDDLWIILSGRVAVRVDRGVGPRLVVVWTAGEASGMLPYSRMSAPPGDNVCEVETELLRVHRDHFPEMIQCCPTVTAYCVHLMLDRARGFNTSDLQDEKMASLGRISAGLAHELNNPASAVGRSAARLRQGLATLEAAWRGLTVAGADEVTLGPITHAREMVRQAAETGVPPSAIERADQETVLEAWLMEHGLDEARAGEFVEASFTTELLEQVARDVPANRLAAALEWLLASSATDAMLTTIEQGAARIHDLVAAMKGFSYMDNLASGEPVDLAAGIRDTVRVLASKARAEGVDLIVELPADLPRVRAAGGELNQVWFNLIDNALDATPRGGHVRVTGATADHRVVIGVVDDGPGVPQHLVDTIFDPFFTTKPPGKGTGLGLDIARRLIRRHSGDLTVQSSAGLTEFRVSLPAASSGTPVRG